MSTPARSPRPSAHPAHSRLGLTALVVALVLAAAGIATAIPYVSAKELVGDVAYQTFTVVGA